MTTADLLTALARKCPDGVSFEPMAVRLLRSKVSLEDWQIEDLKAAMFQIGSGRWFSSEMILNEDSLLVFKERVIDWLQKYDCFSVARLFEDFRAVLRHITTSEDCSIFLQHLGFTVLSWEPECHFCSLHSINLDDALAAISEMISERLEEAGGTLIFQEIQQATPNLTAEAMESIRAHFLPEVHKAEIGGTPCWCSTEAIALPEDFAEKLTTIVNTLVAIKEKVSVSKLEFALNLFYCTRFREEYALLDSDTFLHICAKHYQGENTIFPNTNELRVKVIDSSISSKRVRSPNTRFCNLGVPIGAELIFTRNNQIICTVLDDSNQVEYNGNALAISSLAMHLLGISSANGFSFFSYEGETLLERRLRMERESKRSEARSAEMSQATEVKVEEGEIIGLSGKIISTSTWHAFKRDGTNPHLAKWVQRVEKGESVEQIARESGYAVPTMKGMIYNYHLYFKVCKLNGIVPEGGTNV